MVRAWLGVGMVGSTLLLTGCAQFNKVFDNSNSDGNYERSGSVQALDLPPDLTAPQYDSTFTVNNGNSPISARTTGVGSSNVLPQSVDMAIKGQGNKRYLEVDLPAGALWQKIQDFWASTDVKLRRNEAQIGVMETDWIVKKGELPRSMMQKLLGSILTNINDMGLRDRYTLRVERAGNKSNIYMTHRGAEQVVGDYGSSWEMRPASPEKAAEMLNRLQAYLQTHAKKTKPKANVVTSRPQPVRKAPVVRPPVTRATVSPALSKPATKATTPLAIRPTLNKSVTLSTTGALGADVVNVAKRKAPVPRPAAKRPPIVKAAAREPVAKVQKTAPVPAAEPVVPKKAVKLAFLSTTNDGQPALGVRRNYKQTFAQMDGVLKKAGFSIDGKNTKNGLYAIEYKGVKGKKNVVKKGSKQILHIIKIDKVSAMRLLDVNGKPLNANKAKKILRSIENTFNGS